jgi:hypothetical protein
MTRARSRAGMRWTARGSCRGPGAGRRLWPCAPDGARWKGRFGARTRSMHARATAFSRRGPRRK